MPKITVLVPCLNMEEYIQESIRSIQSQTLSDIEILVIDAGSTDHTLKILRTIADNDERINIIHSDKKSYGYQVNKGIELASGEFITIVDADDNIVADDYEVLYNLALKYNCDYAKGQAKFFYKAPKNDKEILYSQFKRNEYDEDGLHFVNPCESPDLIPREAFLWTGIYRSELMKKVRLHETPGASYQDLGGLLQTILYAKKAVYINKPVYNYRQDNIGASEYNPKAFELVLNEYKWVYEKYFKNIGDEWKKYFYYKLMQHIDSRYYVMSESGKFWDSAAPVLEGLRDWLAEAEKQGVWSSEVADECHWKLYRDFLSDIREIYNVRSNLFFISIEEIGRILQWSNGHKIVLCSFGNWGKKLYELLRYFGSDLIAICDNNSELIGTKVDEYQLIDICTALKRYKDAYYIVANKNSYGEIKSKLIDGGIEFNHITRYDGSTYYFRIFRGKSLLEKYGYISTDNG